MFGYDVFGSPVSFGSEFDIDKKNPIFGTVDVKWMDSTDTYHYKAFGMNDWENTNVKDAINVKDFSSIKTKLNAGQGLSFQSFSSGDDTTPDTTGDETKSCDDPNRQTKSDGSCAANCDTGYEFDSAYVCVPIEESESEGSSLTTLAIIGGIGLVALVVLGS